MGIQLMAAGRLCAQTLPENRVSEIAVRGLIHASEDEIRKVISVQLGDDITRRETELKIRRDISSITALKKFRTVSVADEDVATGKRIIYQVYEYPILVDATFAGNHKLRTRTLREEMLPEKKRMIFLSPEVEKQHVEKLRQYCQKKGYSNIGIEHRTEVTGEGEATIHFTIEEGSRTKITEAYVDGNYFFTHKQVFKSIRSRPSWFIFTRRYNKAQMDADLATIEQMYRDNGYLDVKATADTPTPSYKRGGVAINISVEEGAQYVTGKVRIEGNTLFGEDEIRETMLTDRGEVFNQSQFFKDLDAVRDLYRDQGYILAQVQPRLEKDENNDVVDVNLNVVEGHLIFLGNLIVQGVTTFDDGTREPIGLKTRDYVILREIRMSWYERIPWKKIGRDPSLYTQQESVMEEREEPYVLDWGEIKKSKRRLENLGFFKKDRVEFEPQLTEDPEIMDLLVRLEEQHTGNISFGAGFSTEYGASLFFGLSEKNLFGRGQALDLSGEIGSRRRSFRIGFTEPYLFNSDYSFGADLYNTTIERFSGRDFQENRKGGSIRIGRKFWENYSWFVRLKHEAVELDEVFYRGGRVVTQDMPPEYEELSTKVNSLTLTLAKDTRDYFQAPTKGYRNVASIEQAGFGGTPFTKVKAETSWYTKLSEKLVLAVNGEVGAIAEFSDEIPLSERFFLGGAETVRGYEYGTISPVDYISYWRDDHGLYLDRRDVRVGGEEMLLLKTEVRYPITDIIEGVVFVDAGGTWRELGDLDTGVIRYSTGLGLRIQLPIGAMIRLDYGHALNPDRYQDTQPIHFSFGHSF